MHNPNEQLSLTPPNRPTLWQQAVTYFTALANKARPNSTKAKRSSNTNLLSSPTRQNKNLTTPAACSRTAPPGALLPPPVEDKKKKKNNKLAVAYGTPLARFMERAMATAYEIDFAHIVPLI